VQVDVFYKRNTLKPNNIYIYEQHNDKIRQRGKVQGEEHRFHK